MTAQDPSLHAALAPEPAAAEATTAAAATGPQSPQAEPEFVAWAAEHQREQRRHEAELAQITTHPDASADQDAIGQQQAWARRHAHERHLHDSAIAQMRSS